ncbi:MAG: glycosyl hydrolase [Eubacterium sp.]|nr:glycosyl hydrolase [Eubacterium sp.]
MDNKIWSQRADELLQKLTLEEKIGMIHGAQLFQTAGVERLGIPPLKMSDGPMGVRQEFLPSSWKPVGCSDDYVTYLPCNSAIASTWNRNIAYDIGSVLGEEARGRGKDVILAPGVNIKRSPLCGRNFEYFSEDPYLTGELAAAYIQGVQLWDVAACVKHFAVNNQETERLWVDVEIDEEALREIYFPAFYDAVKKGGAYTVMGAYNKVYGEHSCQSEFLLNQVLRKEWGFDGVIISDWGGVHDTKEAANGQLDIEMSVTDDFDDYFMARPLLEKIKSGEISENTVNQKVKRILLLMLRLHMLSKEQRKSGAYNTPEHRRRVLEAARESVVLLKNDKRRLPLKPAKQQSILLIGENAQQLHANGGGSAEIKALYEISPLMGLKSRLGGNAQVAYARGYCGNEETLKQQETNWQEKSLENGGGMQQSTQGNNAETREQHAQLSEKRKMLRKEAVRLAADYDTVIFVGGLDHTYDCEGNDRADLVLPYEQDLLIRQLLEVRSDLIVVLLAGSPVQMRDWIDQADTVVWSWYAGMEGGNALADVLLGRVNPSGKLPESFYKTLTDCPAHAVGTFADGKTVSYREGCEVGYRYLDNHQIEPEFCFGHGLSYTEFVYSDARLDDEKQQVLCVIENTGAYDGSEVVQVYVRRKDAKLYQELKGFTKVFVKAGEKAQVSVALHGGKQTRGMDECVTYCIGSSSRDIRLIL